MITASPCILSARVLRLAVTSLVTLAGLCATHPAAAQTANARVVGLYVELAPGVMIERAAGMAENGRTMYAEVRIAAGEGGNAKLVLVRLDGVPAGLGDTVEIMLGEKGRGLLTGPRPTPTRLVRVDTRSDALAIHRP